jgi:hypothetical protein
MPYPVVSGIIADKRLLLSQQQEPSGKAGFFSPEMRPMPTKPLFALNFDSPGTVEYVLGKAGLYQATRTDAGSEVEPTNKLRRMFPGGIVPPEETLIPILTFSTG